MKEEWKNIPNISDYEVSSLGNVRRATKGKSTFPGKLLKPQANSWGYLGVTIERRTCRVHSLVAAAFLPPRGDNSCVRHLDGNKSNNAASNLMWGTAKENVADTKLHGRTPNRKGVSHPSARLTDYDIQQIRDKAVSGMKKNAIAKEFGVTPSAITQITKGKRWSHLPEAELKIKTAIKQIVGEV